MTEYERIERQAFETGDRERINLLGEWYQLYGDRYWNGEHYTIKYEGREHSLTPIQEQINEDGDFEVIGWELK